MGKTTSPDIIKPILTLFNNEVPYDCIDIILSYNGVDYPLKIDAKYKYSNYA